MRYDHRLESCPSTSCPCCCGFISRQFCREAGLELWTFVNHPGGFGIFQALLHLAEVSLAIPGGEQVPGGRPTLAAASGGLEGGLDRGLRQETASHSGGFCAREDCGLHPPSLPRRWMARAATAARLTREMALSDFISSFALAVRGMVSVGLKAVAVVKARKRSSTNVGGQPGASVCGRPVCGNSQSGGRGL